MTKNDLYHEGGRDALIACFSTQYCVVSLWATVRVGPLSAIVTLVGLTEFDKE